MARTYFIRTSEDSPEKGPYTVRQLKESVQQDRIKENAIARQKDKEATTTVGQLIAEEALAEERDHRRKSEVAEHEAKKPAAWRVVPLALLVCVGGYQSYQNYKDWEFSNAVSNIGFSSSGSGPSRMPTLIWVGVTLLALYGLYRWWADRTRPPPA
jgi:hypothetical protein